VQRGFEMDTNYNNYNDIAEILKALSHPIRLCIVRGLIQNGKCNVSHMQDCLKMPQSTVSQHLQKLKAAGIIKGERCGTEIKYAVVNETAIKILNSIFTE
jgi:DNA-binding transcriptional ArsR family regulator